MHRDISSGNVLAGREGEQLRGYPIDFDHAIRVKDVADPYGYPADDSPSSNHRTGTAPFMALDHLVPPRQEDHPMFPTWHLPRYDLESFVWVFCWTLHHFKAVQKRNGESYRRWTPAKEFDAAFHGQTRDGVRGTKWQWAIRTPTRDTEIDESFASLKPLMDILVRVVVDAYQIQESYLRVKGYTVRPDFAEMEGKFNVDHILGIMQRFHDSM